MSHFAVALVREMGFLTTKLELEYVNELLNTGGANLSSTILFVIQTPVLAADG